MDFLRGLEAEKIRFCDRVSATELSTVEGRTCYES